MLQQQNHDDCTNATVYTDYWCSSRQRSNDWFVEQFYIIYIFLAHGVSHA